MMDNETKEIVWIVFSVLASLACWWLARWGRRMSQGGNAIMTNRFQLSKAIEAAGAWFDWATGHYEHPIQDQAQAPRQPARVASQPPAAPVRTQVITDRAWLTQKPRTAPHIALSKIAQADNIAIIGQKGSGKTTLLLTILAHRQSQYIALDPHNSPGKWPCQVAGSGRKYAEIDAALRGLDAAMNKRFEQLASGEVAEGQFERRTLVADEFRSITQQLPNSGGKKGAGRYILDRISEGRKVGECVLLAGHNDTIGDLGIEGSSAMKTCFDYLIYTAGIAVQRYGDRDKGNATSEMLAELRDMERPMAVWETANDRWFILDFDLQPQVASVAVVPEGGSGNQFPVVGGAEPVPERGNQTGTSTELVPERTGLDIEVIKALHHSGWSNNRIASKMTGRREDRLARIRQALGESAA